ncbi:MAG: hypothetical protein ACI865_000773 [Flavobacteriaceae bacterium]|jgi:hypothetical protein
MRHSLKSHLFLIFGLSLFVNSNVFSQNITLDYDKVLLNEILLDLNTRYAVQVSISSKLSSQCEISLKKKVTSVQKAIDLLSEYCGLDVQKIGQVYTFRKRKKRVAAVTKPTPKRRKRFLFQGEVLDGKSLEPLPYTSITIGKSTIKSDQKGRFSFRGFRSIDLFEVKHLGYTIIDTSLSSGSKHMILLTTDIQEFEEINIIRLKPAETYRVTSGDEAGRIQLNNIGSKFIPGSNNDFIFNNLRMYPGIMAAGESSSEFIVWGSYPGQGQITYDGITLFNGAGMNGDLGRVNPLMIQNIEVYKGGYNVNIGDRVGSAIIIDSKDGQKKTSAAINLDNQMASVYISVPLLKKTSTLQIAARKSYYQLAPFQEKFTSDKVNFVYPNYDYGDFNLKFTTVLKNRDRIQVSSIASLDGYDEYLDKKDVSAYNSHLSAYSFQLGNSINYTHNWKNGGITRLLFAQSMFKPKESFTSTFTDSSNLIENYVSSLENGIDEYKLRLEHSLSASPTNQLDFSAAFIRNQCTFDVVEGAALLKEFDNSINRFSVYVKDQLTLWNRLYMQFGLKSDFLLTQLKPYIQPRVNGKLALNENWNVNFGWGIYNQFVSKVQLVDSSGARSLIWSLADKLFTPVQRSMHTVVGLSYLGKSLEFGVEGYYKTFDGISRYSANDSFTDSEIIGGYGYGLDLFSKLRFKKHEIILSYSLGQFNELTNSKPTSDIAVEAEQSQRHEIKTSLNLRFKPITISLAGVYGSGFPFTSIKEDEIRPYSRFDIAIRYTKRLKKTSFSTGISILNLLNTSNSRLFRTTNFSDNSSYSTLGIPLTPTLFFNFNL